MNITATRNLSFNVDSQKWKMLVNLKITDLRLILYYYDFGLWTVNKKSEELTLHSDFLESLMN